MSPLVPKIAPPSIKTTDVTPVKSDATVVVNQTNKATGYIDTTNFIGKIITPVGGTVDFSPTRPKAAVDKWLL